MTQGLGGTMTKIQRTVWAGSAVILCTCLVGTLQFGVGSGQAGTPKDCVSVEAGEPAIVQEGRYNILCLRPIPGPFTVACYAEGVPGPHTLVLYPFDIDGPARQRIEIAGDGPVLTLQGMAGPDAHLFLSYDGPFDPIRDGYSLTCRW